MAFWSFAALPCLFKFVNLLSIHLKYKKVAVAVMSLWTV
jgi:hypothetical protein